MRPILIAALCLASCGSFFVQDTYKYDEEKFCITEEMFPSRFQGLAPDIGIKSGPYYESANHARECIEELSAATAENQKRVVENGALVPEFSDRLADAGIGALALFVLEVIVYLVLL